jgi:hypothetical protein
MQKLEQKKLASAPRVSRLIPGARSATPKVQAADDTVIHKKLRRFFGTGKARIEHFPVAAESRTIVFVMYFIDGNAQSIDAGTLLQSGNVRRDACSVRGNRRGSGSSDLPCRT